MSDFSDAAYEPEKRTTSTEVAEPENDAQTDAQPPPPPVRIPIRPGSEPFDAIEYADVAPEAAGHWSMDVWHAEPPR